MKCPYCGAEARGNICEYCDSELYRIEPAVQPAAQPAEPAFVGYLGDTAEEQVRAFLKDVGSGWSFSVMMFDASGRRVTEGKINQRILKYLDIGDRENIYLIHDDTIFGSGKNGFAITSEGFHCLEMLGSRKMTTWKELAEASDFRVDSHMVKADGTELAYFTSGDQVLPQLLKLCRSLKELYIVRGSAAL